MLTVYVSTDGRRYVPAARPFTRSEASAYAERVVMRDRTYRAAEVDNARGQTIARIARV